MIQPFSDYSNFFKTWIMTKNNFWMSWFSNVFWQSLEFPIAGHIWSWLVLSFVFFRWFSLGSWCDWKLFMGPPSPLHNPHWTWLDGWQLFWDAPIWRYLQCFEPEPKLTPKRPLRFRCLRVLAHGWSSTITSWWIGTSTLDVLDAIAWSAEKWHVETSGVAAFLA
jgi:hypothetical protein